MNKRLAVAFAFSALIGCSNKEERGTCLNESSSVKSCTVNQFRYQCEGQGNVFHAGEKSGAGVLFCNSHGYTNPMNSAYDLKGQNYRLDIPVGNGDRNVQKALDEGHVVTYFDAKYPRFR
jgi:hypothetical protein